MIGAVVILLALLLLGIVLQDTFEVMLLPRRVRRRLRLMRGFFHIAWWAWSSVGSVIPQGSRRERWLSAFGPLSMISLFTLWALGFMLGFGMLLWAVQELAVPTGANDHPVFLEQLYLSGVTFFTLGYGDVVPKTLPARILAVGEAGTGFSLIAIVIGYLPVLYQLFSRREAHVIQLDGRAGSPPTAGTLLLRHAGGDGTRHLDALLQVWEMWGAELLESHLSYPMLAYYRSQHDNQSWLGAIAAVMDTSALILVGLEGPSLLQARMTFAMLRQVMLEMNASFRLPVSRVARIDRLPHDAFVKLDAALTDSRLGWAGGTESEELLAALRSSYEPMLGGLSIYLMVPLPGWMPDAGAADHWAEGARGTLARRLVHDLASRGEEPDGRPSLWRKIRGRLK